jgi:SPP1 gp7 family putative phage head morphogenesis protein
MDKARKETDKALLQMEKEISKIYREANADIFHKWNQYMDEVKPQVDALHKAYEEAKKSGDEKLIRKTGKAYGIKLREYTLKNRYYKDMIDQTAAQISHANETALAYINGQMPKIYTINYNQMAIDARGVRGYSFNLVNESTVKNLITNGEISLLPKKLDVPKDMAWNIKAINSQVLQGIIQGESVDKIALRLQSVTTMDEKSSIRNARTMVTGAECKGRQDSYDRATKDGIIMKKVWMAVQDEKTRESHAELNGVEVDVDEAFDNELMYPGDPTGDPSEVYNCRCSMKSHIVGFRHGKGN